MSRKHYRAIAEALAESLRITPDAAPILREVARDLAAVMARDNGRFDRERFMRAAGFGE